ncbi:MAG: AtpZ/AtpI family protein [Bacteroidota bacterium]
MATKRTGDYAHRTPGTRPADQVPRPDRVGSSPGAALKAAGPYLNVGIQVGLTMAMMAGLGYLADDWLGTSPWGILLGSLFGVIAVFAVLMRLVADLNRQSAQRNGGRSAKASAEAKTGPGTGD